jgi:anti-sigma factor ChrR (cupin superfamily)
MEGEPGFRRIPASEMPWQETREGVRYVALQTAPGDPGAALVVMSQVPAGGREPPHSHSCSLVEFILEGEMRIGKFVFQAGDARVMKADVGYGPSIAGASGCVRLTVFERADGGPMRLLGKGETVEA